jgi:4-hydroxy-4-methyl-2-oxoglutarate aldolase
MASTIPASIIRRYMKLSGPDVSDGLERNGLRGAAHGVLPLWPACRKIVGPAMTLKLVRPRRGGTSGVLDTLRAVVAGGKGSVLVIDNGGRADVNSFGGIVGNTAKHNGVAGIVSDGAMRDVNEYMRIGLPCYATGPALESIRGRSTSLGFGKDVRLAGVKVRPGDLVFADVNGVVIVPQDSIVPVLEAAELVLATEQRIIAAVKSGVDPIKAHEDVDYDVMLKKRRPAGPAKARQKVPGRTARRPRR